MDGTGPENALPQPFEPMKSALRDLKVLGTGRRPLRELLRAAVDPAPPLAARPRGAAGAPHGARRLGAPRAHAQGHVPIWLFCTSTVSSLSSLSCAKASTRRLAPSSPRKTKKLSALVQPRLRPYTSVYLRIIHEMVSKCHKINRIHQHELNGAKTSAGTGAPRR